MRKLFVFLFLVSSMAILFGCGKSDSPSSNQTYLDLADCSGISVTYTDVEPIIATNCSFAGCHDNNTAAAGIKLFDYDNLVSEFESTQFLCSINHGSGCDNMPQNLAKLSETAIATITCWAKSNFPE